MDTKPKDKFYFSHDSNARRDPKIIALRSKYGYEGYGRYFALIEIMRESKGYMIDMSKGYVIQSVASELEFEDSEKCKKFIKDCIDFELLETDDIFAWSNSLLDRMKMFEEKRQRYVDMAKKRWQNNGESKKEKNDSQKRKETKKNSDKKEVPYKSIESLRNDDLFREVILSEIKNKEEFSCLSNSDISSQRDVCIDWLKSSGKRYKDYRAFFFNWLRRYIKDKGISGSTDKKKMVY